MQLLSDLSTRGAILINSLIESFKDPMFFIGFLIVFFVFIRWWGIKKLIGFIVLTLAALFLMFEIEKYMFEIMGKDGSSIALLLEPLFFCFLACSFIYFGFIKGHQH